MMKYWQTILAGVCVGALAFGLLVKPSQGHRPQCATDLAKQLWQKYGEVPTAMARSGRSGLIFYGNGKKKTGSLVVQGPMPGSGCIVMPWTHMSKFSDKDIAEGARAAKKQWGAKKLIKPMKGGMDL